MIQLIFVAVNIAMAWWHAKLIKENRPIKHGWWGLAYVVAAAATSFISKDWILFILLLLIRKLVFDLSLNIFRGLPPFHISLTTTSIIDKLQRKLFGTNGALVAIVYGAVILLLNLVKLIL
jgi:hypothetical protein